VGTRIKERLKKVGCIENKRKRDRDRVIVGRERIESGSENELYFGKTGDD
jgi:hypothetical protein